MSRVFISHSSKDVATAQAVVELIRAALPLRPNEIRCTSVDGHRLPTGARTDEVLRSEVEECDVLIALLTKNSLHSTYVIFELGARWGARKLLFPVLAGIRPRDLSGPLTAINARACSSRAELLQLVIDLAEALRLEAHHPPAYEAALARLLETVQVPTETSNARQRLCRQLTHLSARDMCEQIRNAPPLKRDEVAEAFFDLRVNWEAQFSQAYSRAGSSTVGIVVNPWVPDGFDTVIHCEIDLNLYPELKELEKDAPVRVIGVIEKITSYDIFLREVTIAGLTDEEKRGTRMAFVVPVVARNVGSRVAQKATQTGIIDAIKTQLTLGHPSGHRVDNRGVILPEIVEESKAHTLLVLYASKHLLETLAPKSLKLDSIDQEIYNIENGGGCAW